MPADLGPIAETLRRSTVQVENPGHSGGSGVIWSADGKVVTNSHVVRGTQALVHLWDGRSVEAPVVARDARRDLAALRVTAAGLQPAAFRDSTDVKPGEFVLAVGNPLGFTGALSTGVVHAVGPVAGHGNYVQAAVRLAPGNSGGPLADAEGRVIGINTMVVFGAGLGLAVPSNTVAKFMERGPARPPLGVTLQSLGQGLLVIEVSAGSPAANASLRPGDILVGVDGRRIRQPDDLADALESGRGPLRLEFVRGAPRVREVTVLT